MAMRGVLIAPYQIDRLTKDLFGATTLAVRTGCASGRGSLYCVVDLCDNVVVPSSFFHIITIGVLTMCSPNPLLPPTFQRSSIFVTKRLTQQSSPKDHGSKSTGLRILSVGKEFSMADLHVATSPSTVAATQMEYLQAESPFRASATDVSCSKTRQARIYGGR